MYSIKDVVEVKNSYTKNYTLSTYRTLKLFDLIPLYMRRFRGGYWIISVGRSPSYEGRIRTGDLELWSTFSIKKVVALMNEQYRTTYFNRKLFEYVLDTEKF